MYVAVGGAGADVLNVDGLHKNYDETIAVSNLSFDVKPGQILGMVGPNGAGKTTTLRCVSGIIPPTRGAVRIGDYFVDRDPVQAKSLLAYVPDDPKLYDALTVWEHFEFVASAYKTRGWESRAEEWLERFELTSKRDALAQELSRGMRQKCAIVCAYVHQPSLLMFDEPIAGLDPRGIRTLKDSITEHAAAGAAVIVSSHMLSLAEGLCSHLLILHRGESLYCGPIGDVRASFDDLNDDASLEDVFFRATEEPSSPWQK